MPPDSFADARRRLCEAYALLDALSDQWKDDLSLRGQAVVASEHVKIALDALATAEDFLRSREFEAPQ